MTYQPRTRSVIWLAALTAILALSSVAAIWLLEVRIDKFGQHAFRFLVWNLFLAWIPYVLALGLAVDAEVVATTSTIVGSER